MTSHPDARAVLLRAIAVATSNAELDDLRALALAHPGQSGGDEIERAVKARRAELDRAGR